MNRHGRSWNTWRANRRPILRKQRFVNSSKRSTPAPARKRRFFSTSALASEHWSTSWRRWVESQGYGYGEPPSARIPDALLNRVLPVIQNPLAPHADRIQAIRNWRKAGVPIGAGTLIDLLRNPGDIPKDEIIWSLSRRLGNGMGR